MAKRQGKGKLVKPLVILGLEGLGLEGLGLEGIVEAIGLEVIECPSGLEGLGLEGLGLEGLGLEGLVEAIGTRGMNVGDVTARRSFDVIRVDQARSSRHNDRARLRVF